jgi:hypothetical protein
MRPSRTTILLAAVLVSTTPRPAAAQAAAHYRHAADVFELLDNVSNWWPGYSDAQYRDYWVRRVGLSAADDTLLVRYAKLRERYVDKTGQSNEDPAASEGGLFTGRATLSADPVGDVFFQSGTIAEALRRLDGVVEPEELRFLRRFYANFEQRYLPLVTEHERAVQASLAETNRILTSQAFGTWIGDIERFFNVPTQPYRYDALYVWWPDSVHVVANPRGRFLVLRALVKPGETLNVGDVVAHEVIHVIAARQPSEQKRSITDAFLRGCPANASVGRLSTIEEPLAVVLGNMLFTREFRRERYRYAKRWYGDAWVDPYAKLLFSPLVVELERGGRITDGVVAQAVQLCTALLSLRDHQLPGK